MPVKFKSELGVACVALLLCVLVFGVGWLLSGGHVLAIGAELAGMETPAETTEVVAEPEPTPADAALAITEADELAATRAAVKSVAPVTRTVAVGLDAEAEATAAYTLIPVLADGEYVGTALEQNGAVVLSIPDLCEILDLACTAAHEGAAVTYTVEGVEMRFVCGEQLYTANGRTLYEPNGVLALDGDIVLPPEALAKLFGAAIAYDETAAAVNVDPAAKAILQDGESYYAAHELYWLSHIVYAESNGQPLEGMIGVGNVVLNRVASERFPNTVEGVVFQSGQFNPVDMGTIYLEPSEQAVLAAKLAIEGVNTVGGSLFFVNPVVGDSSWFNQSLTLTCVIADHAFYM